MNVRSWAYQAFQRFGLEVHRSPLRGSHDDWLQRILRAREIDHVVDIGANEGQFGRRLRKLGYTGPISSFEPSTRCYSVLSTLGDPLWSSHQLAVGDREGVATLHLYEESQLDSLHSASAWGDAHWNMDRFGTEQVPVRTLDRLTETLGWEPSRTFVKVDTQGHDAAVLSGGTGLLSRAVALQIELPQRKLYADTPDMLETLARALDLGFELVSLAPVAFAPPDELTPLEFDALFLRPVDVPAPDRRSRGAP